LVAVASLQSFATAAPTTTPTTTPMTPARTCAKCGKSASVDTPLHRCGGCRAVYYCSRECQAIEWKASHKVACVVLPK
jgi:hypothetical protein